jgi:hypothetical protein
VKILYMMVRDLVVSQSALFLADESWRGLVT